MLRASKRSSRGREFHIQGVATKITIAKTLRMATGGELAGMRSTNIIEQVFQYGTETTFTKLIKHYWIPSARHRLTESVTNPLWLADCLDLVSDKWFPSVGISANHGSPTKWPFSMIQCVSKFSLFLPSALLAESSISLTAMLSFSLWEVHPERRREGKATIKIMRH